ncbi:MAG: isopentenyl-diphosphate Delta-isomerase [Flavobacteriaceae bacterium]|nr:isopentenyl-diphosphate Delta-isomerase [Flavobacteriaceae bacterium]
MKEEEVILVDSQDQILGTMPKMEAHEKGVLHRAFSIFILNSKRKILLQKRAKNKYHSSGLWTNTCCSHQRINETSISAGNRRLKEEMGIDTNLEEIFTFKYKATFANGLTEHELDHILIGFTEKKPIINTDEVSDWKWENIDFIHQDLSNNPNKYTIWFKIIFDEFINYLKIDESNSK